MSQCFSIIIDHGISETGHGKEVVDGLNVIDKHYIYQLLYNVQLPGSKTIGKQILIHSCTQKNDVSLAEEFQKHLSKENYNHGVIDQGKYRKIASKRKWTYREYNVQDNDDVSHKEVKMYYLLRMTR